MRWKWRERIVACIVAHHAAHCRESLSRCWYAPLAGMFPGLFPVVLNRKQQRAERWLSSQRHRVKLLQSKAEDGYRNDLIQGTTTRVFISLHREVLRGHVSQDAEMTGGSREALQLPHYLLQLSAKRLLCESKQQVKSKA